MVRSDSGDDLDPSLVHRLEPLSLLLGILVWDSADEVVPPAVLVGPDRHCARLSVGPHGSQQQPLEFLDRNTPPAAASTTTPTQFSYDGIVVVYLQSDVPRVSEHVCDGIRVVVRMVDRG
jgi:hypothetical protein